MTRDQIMSMTAQELAEATAVHVMGWTWTEEDGGCWKTKEGEYVHLWFPTEDISAAWEVADKLKIAIIPQSEGAPDNMKYMAVIEEDIDQAEIKVFAASAPEAICKAALLAVMGI